MNRVLATLAALMATAPAAALERQKLPPHVQTTLQAGDFAGALAAVRPLKEACERAAPSGSTDCIDLVMTEADLLSRLGRLSDGEALWRRALAIADERIGPRSPESGFALGMLAMNLAAQARYSDQEPLLQRLVALSQERYGATNPNTVAAAINLASLLGLLGRQAEAETLLTPVLAQLQATQDVDRILLSGVMVAVGSSLSNQNRCREAEPLLREAIEIYQGAFGEANPATMNALLGLASCHQNNGRGEEAAVLVARVIVAAEPQPAASGMLVSALMLQARQKQASGDLVGAEASYRRALIITRADFGAQHPMVRVVAAGHALVLADLGRYAEAESVYRALFASLESAPAAARMGPLEEGILAGGLAYVLDFGDKWSEAEPMYRKALKLMRPISRPADPMLIAAEGGLAWGLIRAGRSLPEARSLLRRASGALLARVATYPGFDPLAQAELRKNAPVFTGQVKAAWKLAEGRSK